MLRLNAYINNVGDLPSFAELLPHIRDIRVHMQHQYDAVVAGGLVAPGARQDWLYRERFNLSLADADLLRVARPRAGGGSSSPQVDE